MVLLLAWLVTPGVSGAEQRVWGIGFNFAGGAGAGTGWKNSENQGSLARPYVDLAGLELRLFPTDKFSIDLHWSWLQMAVIAGMSGESGAYQQSTYFHFRMGPEELVSFALAPFVHAMVGRLYEENFVAVGLGSRIGGDFSSSERVFEFGVYFRPSLQFGGGGDLTAIAFEGVVELTWVWHTFK